MDQSNLKITVATGEPNLLIKAIKDKIDNNLVKTWDYDEDKFYHVGDQYRDHVYFTHTFDEKKGIVIFKLQSDGDSFSERKVPQLFINMLDTHFS